MTDHEEDDDSVWIRSHPDKDGRYHLVLELGPDDVEPLTAESAYGWAREVLSAVAAAEYDAAILRQQAHIGVDQRAAVHLVQEIRADRAGEIPISMIPGLTMTPGVSARTMRGMVTLHRKGREVGQWDLDAARDHVLTLLTSVEVAMLDGAYARTLIHKFGVEPGRAFNVVDDLGTFREPTG